jgi:hypothetical protein
MRNPSRGVAPWLAVAGGLVATGAILAGVGLASGGGHSHALPAVTVPPRSSPPHPRASAPRPAVRASPRPSRRGPGAPAMLPPDTRPLAASAPVRLAIPAIGVNADVIGLGENPNGSVQVPPLTEPSLTSWFDEGPAPGQDGPAAVYGHVDTAATGPAVFYRIGDLTAGDTVTVTLADHQAAVFQVYQVAEYPKDAFPTTAVYGDTPGPELRLITCGGAFDAAAGSYDDNIVAYARLTSAHPA